MMTKQWWTLFTMGWLMIGLMGCVPAETPELEPEAGRPAEQATPADTPEPIEEDVMATEEPLSDEERIEIRETIGSEPSAEPLEEPISEGDEEAAGDELPENAIVGEVPAEIINNIMAEIAGNNENADVGEMTVRRAEAVVFNDGSLGCPQPGEFYTMALVSGYVVEIVVDGQVYDYRVNNNGFFRLCEDGRSYVPPAGTPDA